MFKGSIPALVTPMRGDGAVDFEAWDRLLKQDVKYRFVIDMASLKSPD